jgi:hypothetical protein
MKIQYIVRFTIQKSTEKLPPYVILIYLSTKLGALRQRKSLAHLKRKLWYRKEMQILKYVNL